MRRLPDEETLLKLSAPPDLSSRKNAQEFLRFLNKNRYKMAWRHDRLSGKEGLVISIPNNGWPAIGKSASRTICEVLEVDSKESWEVEKEAAGV